MLQQSSAFQDVTTTPALTQRHVSAGGLRWLVEEGGGDAERPTILLLHGTGGTLHTWHSLLPTLTPRARVVSVDLPGHGGTESPGFAEVTLPSMTARVCALMQTLEIEPAAVLSHSAGAAIMLQLAADGVLSGSTALIGINPAVRPPSPVATRMMSGSLGELMRSPLTRFVVRGLGQFPPVIELLLSSTGSKLSPEQEREYVRAFTDPRHAESAFAMMANWDLTALGSLLPTIQQETVFVVGMRDSWVPPSVAIRAAARMPRARVVKIQNAGHLVHEERPGEVASLVLAAIEQSAAHH